MAREAHIPLALWVSAALVFHAVGGGGSLEVARTVLDKQQLRELLQGERRDLRPEDRAFEVVDIEGPSTPAEPSAVAPSKESDPSDEKVEPDPDAKVDPTAPPPPPKPKEAEPKAPEPLAAKPPEPEKKTVIPLPLVPAVPVPPAPPPPPPKPDGRLAIQQHAKKDQPDNPNAARIADDANTVAEETMAKIRSHDQDMADPSPGAPKAMGPKEDVGNSDKNKEAHSEDKDGRDDRAPGESARASTSGTHSTPAQAGPKTASAVPPPSVAGAKGGGARSMVPATPATPPPSPGGAGPTSPEVESGGQRGTWAMDPANPGGDGSSKIAGRRRPGKPFNNPVHVGSMGLGSSGSPGGPNTNLTMPGLVAAVGDEKLRQEREADGASRRGEHAGRMIAGTNFQKYKAAIENYDPSVKQGERTSLNAARVPWASYLNSIHNKIHPFFAERELEGMDRTRDKAFSDQAMYAVAEIVISPENGRVVRRGIVKNSGSTAFDMIVIKSIDSSGPYGKAPDAIVSPDGRVYLHWEFHRNHNDACTTRNAYPIMRSAAAVKATPAPNGAPPKPAAKPADEHAGAAPGPLRPLRE